MPAACKPKALAAALLTMLGVASAPASAQAPFGGMPSATIVQVAAGLRHTCALEDTGQVWCWGYNEFGQIGDGTRTDRLIPVPVTGLTGVAEIALGQFHSCARLTTGRVRCWGNNAYGQIGNGTRTDRLAPVGVTGLTGAAEIAGGGITVARG